MVADPWTFCEKILPDVSRSFALIIPACPPPIDRALCIAYLICRLADTVEDETGLDARRRNNLYDALLRAVDEPFDTALADPFMSGWPAMPEGAYGRLIQGSTEVLGAYAALSRPIRAVIARCVHDMVAGMRHTVAIEKRFGVGFFCRDLAGLDQYCHHVAGTVGIMSTALFEMRFAPTGFVATDAWREQGRRMGLGLQLTNIIKDCLVDAERGVSFVPPRCVDPAAGAYRLSPAGRAELIRHAIAHLDMALQYVLAVPLGETGIRTFLLGSLFPAIATLEAAAPGDQHQPKITRVKMSEIFERIANHAADNSAVADWYAAHRTRALQGCVPNPSAGDGITGQGLPCADSGTKGHCPPGNAGR